MKTNTRDFEEFIRGEARYFLGGSYYDNHEYNEAVSELWAMVGNKGFHPIDFHLTSFMDTVMLEKKHFESYYEAVRRANG
jgi:hypothetical protein